MGLLRFSRKDKPSADSPNPSTSTTRGRIEISSTDTVPQNHRYNLHQKENKGSGRQRKTISRDFFSSSAFKAIIGEKGSLMDDILNELRPEDILEEEAESDDILLPIPHTSTSISTMGFNSTRTSASIANTTKSPTPIATKSAILPRQNISNKGNSNNGLLTQKYMEASNRRHRQSHSPSQQKKDSHHHHCQQQQPGRPSGSENSNNRILRSSFTTTTKHADLCCEIGQKRRKNTTNNKQRYNSQVNMGGS